MINNKVLFFVFILSFFFVQASIVTAQSDMTATASSIEDPGFDPSKAVDGNMNTRWSSHFSDPQWINLDLGEIKELVGVILYWEAAYGETYDIFVSQDKKSWKKVYSQNKGLGGVDDIDFEKCPARYVRLLGKKRGTGWGYSLLEIIFKTENEPFGMGQKDPDVIMKKKWNFCTEPVKTILIPESWAGEDIVVLLSAFSGEYDFYVNENSIAAVKSSKNPVKLNVTEYIKPGKHNLFSIKAKNLSADNSILRAMLVKKSEADKFEELRNSSPIEYYRLLADFYSEGYFPLWLNYKQDYWTLVGTEDSYEESLLSSKGIIGAYTKSFSLMPFLYINNELITFADVEIDLSLENDYLPIPSVRWMHNGLDFNQKLFAYTENDKSYTCIIYNLENNTGGDIEGKLFLAVRPFEVNPPWMHGGLTKISSIESTENNRVIKINGTKGVISLLKPDEFGALCYQKGDIILDLDKGKVSSGRSVDDPSGHASAALAYDFKLSPNEKKEYLFLLPLGEDINDLAIPDREKFFKNYELAKKKWEKRLNKIEIDIPEGEIVDVLRSNIAYILINKDGPALQPGSRSYENSWIRDGALISAALLRTSCPDVSKKYVEWVSKTQLPDGEIPCIVNAKTNKLVDYAKDWKEYDASGEYVFAIADYYNFTKDEALVKETFESVIKALKFDEKLRRTMLSEDYKGTPSYGILPKGHSHEGYLNNPQQSLWDDYWSLRGWKDAQMLAKAAEREDVIPWMAKEEKDFRECLLEDIRLVQSKRNINYIPASIGLAEIDAISMSITLFPTFEYHYLDSSQVNYTLNRYYNSEFLKRLKKGVPATYIPYELRAAHAFLILDDGEKALRMIRYFLKDLRPEQWNHWSEVVPANPSAPVYVGDMPHSWIGAIYINTVRSMFVFEEKDMLILGSGIDEKWLEREEGVSVRGFPTHYGEINYSMKKQGNNLNVRVSGDANPDKGFVFRLSFLDKEIRTVKINKERCDDFSEKSVSFNKLPVDIVVTY